jgi:host factor-I protein
MPTPIGSRRRQKSPPPGDTGQEALYLRFLSEKQVQVAVKLHDAETVSGWIEYFDDRMIRLTREGKPNLFIYKSQIRTITELARRGVDVRRRNARKSVGPEVINHDATNPDVASQDAAKPDTLDLDTSDPNTHDSSIENLN